jgi:large subunit ribosomal protein L35
MRNIKTHSGAKKRFKVTASGKIAFKQTRKRHLLRKRTTKNKRHLTGDAIVQPCDYKRTKLLLGI